MQSICSTDGRAEAVPCLSANTEPATGGIPAQLVLHYWPVPASSGKVGDSYAALALNPLAITVSPY